MQEMSPLVEKFQFDYEFDLVESKTIALFGASGLSKVRCKSQNGIFSNQILPYKCKVFQWEIHD